MVDRNLVEIGRKLRYSSYGNAIMCDFLENKWAGGKLQWLAKEYQIASRFEVPEIENNGVIGDAAMVVYWALVGNSKENNGQKYCGLVSNKEILEVMTA